MTSRSAGLLALAAALLCAPAHAQVGEKLSAVQASPLLEGRVPDADAAVLAHATAQGTVCLGKTHMTELAFSGLGLNPPVATVPNAFDAGLVAGGSSGGAAVSVALGLAAAAIGSDTGGSIRLPAAWNGLVGFKPTTGAVDMAGVLPLCARFDVVGPLARTVEDCAELFALIRGTPAPDLRGAEPGGLRIMVLDGVPFDDAKWFRGRETSARTRSTCPDPECCRLPSADLEAAWGGQAWPAARALAIGLRGVQVEGQHATLESWQHFTLQAILVDRASLAGR